MERPEDRLSRDPPIEPKRTCLLLIDTQNYVWNVDVARRVPYFDAAVREAVLPNLRRLVEGFRNAGAEVMYTVMENMTQDGRDRSLDYKLSRFFIAKGSWEAQVLEDLRPGEDEIVLPKTSSGVFNSTNIEYLLRNIGIDTLMVTGFLTDQCVDHTVRDAAGSRILSGLRIGRLRDSYAGAARQRALGLRGILPHSGDEDGASLAL